MNNLARTFRIFIVATTACHFAWFFFYDVVEPLSELEIRVAEIDGYGSAELFSQPAFYWGWFAAWLFCLIGLFFFKSWARLGYLFMIILMQSLIPFSGYVAAIQLDYLLSSTLLLLSGVILAMSYFSQLAERFKKNS